MVEKKKRDEVVIVAYFISLSDNIHGNPIQFYPSSCSNNLLNLLEDQLLWDWELHQMTFINGNMGWFRILAFIVKNVGSMFSIGGI